MKNSFSVTNAGSLGGIDERGDAVWIIVLEHASKHFPVLLRTSALIVQWKLTHIFPSRLTSSSGTIGISGVKGIYVSVDSDTEPTQRIWEGSGTNLLEYFTREATDKDHADASLQCDRKFIWSQPVRKTEDRRRKSILSTGKLLVSSNIKRAN